ncbi:endo-1,4-beta-xylanase [Teredinibacter waterburyi]|uniref:endo-1,4-beta-xylanase n=1 Tax=Teredinibacter waterburyi TaxID=1500538 RepID=UPI001FE77719|nr:endo-1,4-beta-xylanase [Teredinibacter waterburyi]
MSKKIMSKKVLSSIPLALAVVSLIGCGGSGGSGGATPTPAPTPTPEVTPVPTATPTPEVTPTPSGEITVTNLQSHASFPIGVAVPAGNDSKSVLSSSSRSAIVTSHFGQITAENIMKPAYLHPAESTYFFDDADALVNYATSNGLSVHGHTLVWHSQIPNWMSNFSGDAAAWTSMMESHITTIVSRYADADIVVSWDVLNEIISDSNGALRDSVWLQNIGESYIEKAFIAARAADDDALLYYNDYNLSNDGSKTAAMVSLVTDLVARDIPIDGVGFQMHILSDWPSANAIKNTFQDVVDLGLMVKITELDITMNSDEDMTELSATAEQLQADRYQAVLAAYLEVVPPAQRGGVTVWGITDADSWIPNFRGHPDWPLLFNADYSPKLALQGFADALTAAQP